MQYRDEFNDISSLSKFHTTEILREVFAKHNNEVEEEVIQEISNTVLKKKVIQYLLPQPKKVNYQQIIGETEISGSISPSLNQLSYCTTGLQEKPFFMFLEKKKRVLQDFSRWFLL